MDLLTIQRILVTLAGEAAADQFISPEIFSSMLHLASLKHFKRKLGLPEEYKPGMPYPSQAFELTQRITEDMKIFKVTKGYNLTQPISVASSGIASYPSDYYIASVIDYFFSKDGETYQRKVDILSDLEYQDRVTNIHTRPRYFYPICKMISDGIQCNPYDLKFIHMTYLRLPVAPYYAVDATTGYNEYDSANSTQLEWDDQNTIDIMYLFLSEMGITLKREDVLQKAEAVKERGI